MKVKKVNEDERKEREKKRTAKKTAEVRSNQKNPSPSCMYLTYVNTMPAQSAR